MTPVILPPAAGAAASAVSPASHPAVLATVPDPPAAASRLEAGSIVSGTVLGRDAQGLVTIRTDKGLLALATQAQLPVGSTVALEVRVAGTRLQLVILSVEPPPGGTAPPKPAALAAGGTVGGTAAQAQGGPAGTATPAATPAATLAAALTGGGLVMAMVVHASLPASAGRAAAPGAAAQPPLPTGGAAVAAAGGTPNVPAAGAPPSALPGGAALPGPAAGGTAPTDQNAADQLLALQIAARGPTGSPGGAASVAGGPVPGSPAPGHAAPAGQPSGPTVPSAGSPAGPAAPRARGAAPPDGAVAVPRVEAPSSAAAMPHAATAPALPAAASPGPAPAPLLPGTEVGVRILAASLPGEPAPGAGARPSGAPPATAALVIGQTPAGHPIVDTLSGRLILAIKAALPVGTALLLELPMPGQTPAPAPGAPVASPFQALLKLAQGWPALGEALASLATHGEAAGAQALAARLPSVGPGLAAGILAMIDQFAAGRSGEWLGPALRDALARSGRRDLADRLQSEFRQIARLAGEPAGGDWRVMFLPLHDGRELHQVNLYLRHRQHGGGGEEADTGTRFIVEVEMTRLGPIQLDGLVHGRRFDLMLRSRTPLSPAMRRDIEAIFEEARGIGGYAGAIGFQVASSFPVQPLEQAKRQTPASAVVV